MGFEKVYVPLRDIVPSGANPRRDFGDIKALAEAIEATGGEPVNPIVAVRDGNVYRIVDGERRYRALRELHKGDDGFEVAVLAADGMGAANELVAMLATDDKRPLTEEERARGVQQMLVLGVDSLRIERASRATKGQIAAARMVGGSAPEGVQLTLDQMVAASEFGDEADVEAVLSAGEAWRQKVSELKRRDRERKLMEQARAVLEEAGVPLVAEAPEGMEVVARWYKDGAKRLAEAVASLQGGLCAVDAGYAVEIYAPEGSARPRDPEDEARERERAACRSLFGRIARWVVDPRGGVGRCAEVEQAVREVRRTPWLVGELGIGDEWDAWSARRHPGPYEIGAWVIASLQPWFSTGVTAGYRNAGQNAEAAREALDFIDLVRLAGFDGAEGDDRWLMERLRGIADAGGR